ncbi:sugar ABC transporter substrate-binding protein [Sporosarcina sp. Marseille-Q4063]|uniref:ABC transporter substrate-binding protein n=1 Tax=Sporosarcina sp. Marseille-Q4063 TaxID=2810514 RepID=UPI001BAFE508|nr:sugar ABC transporter substrate-binding protein [Sporosarcina sp. Marseille-Q4063]QUW21555.1 sugar ABC transporter substrate-binding protein [Sporosarcina sp. Marseille-Q4063]
MKNLLKISLLLMLVAGGILAGCGSSDKGGKTADGKTKITFWDENAGPQRTPIWEKLIADFEDANPDIDVDYVGLPKDSSKSKLDTAIAADDMPDVGSVQTSWLPEFSIREALLPLDDYLADSELNELINEGAVTFNKDVVRDGKLYGIPYTQNLDVIWIRSDWFKEAGLEAPDTWDEFFTAVDEMTIDGRYGYTIRGGSGGSFQLQRLMFAYSGLENYFDDNGKSTINDPKHVEFLEKYFELYKKNTPKSDITNDYKEMIAGFDTGVVAMVHHNIGSFGEHSKAFEPDQFEAIPLPKTEDGRYVAEGGNTINMSIFNTTKNPDEAWKFVEFINSAESQSYWNEEVGQIPTNSDVLEMDWIKDSAHIKTAFEVYDNPQTVLYKPPFYLPDYRSILDNTVDPGTQKVMSGDSTVQEFLNEWAKAVEDSEAKYNDAMK